MNLKNLTILTIILIIIISTISALTVYFLTCNNDKNVVPLTQQEQKDLILCRVLYRSCINQRIQHAFIVDYKNTTLNNRIIFAVNLQTIIMFVKTGTNLDYLSSMTLENNTYKDLLVDQFNHTFVVEVKLNYVNMSTSTVIMIDKQKTKYRYIDYHLQFLSLLLN